MQMLFSQENGVFLANANAAKASFFAIVYFI